MMRNVLFLCQRIPWPPIKGEKIRHGHIMRHFAKNNRVFLGTLIDDMADREYMDVVRDQVHDAHFGFVNRKLAYGTAVPKFLLGDTPLSFGVFEHRGLTDWVTRILDTHQPEVVFVCSTNMMPFLANARHQPVSLIADFADVDSEKWVSYADSAKAPWSWIYRREAKLVRKSEIDIANSCDWVTFVTDEEADLFNQVAPGFESKVRGVLSGVDSEFFSPEHDLESAFDPQNPSFVFTGHMDYPPNVQAVQWFSQEVLPIIRQEQADAHFFIVGNRPSDAVKKLDALPGVTVTGRVPDVRSYLAHCTASVAPMRIARGIQNKVLEALSMGLPVVATTGAMTGLDAEPDTHILKAETTAEFADACIQLIKNPDLRQRIGGAARRLIEDGWSWQARLAAFDRLIEAPTARSMQPSAD